MLKRLISSLIVISLILTLYPLKGYTDLTKTEKIVSVAKSQLGVPYRYGGTTTNGFDCSGFIRYVFDKAGIALPRTASQQYNTGEAVNKSELKIGDLVFFETYKPGPSHSGIYVGNSKFIHASSSNGISISSVNDPYYWSSRYLGARRVFVEPVVKVLEALPDGQYHDIPKNHWAYRSVTSLGEQKLINGSGQSLFLPNNLITRAEAAVVLSRVFDLPTGNKKSDFSDVPEDHWAAGAISAVSKEGLITGITENTFSLDEALTREQVAVVFNRAFELKKNSLETMTFSDVEKKYWAYEAIQLLADSGITGGYTDNTYRPKREVTRAEFAVFVDRALQMN